MAIDLVDHRINHPLRSFYIDGNLPRFFTLSNDAYDLRPPADTERFFLAQRFSLTKAVFQFFNVGLVKHISCQLCASDLSGPKMMGTDSYNSSVTRKIEK